MLAAILKNNILTLLALREMDSLILKLLNSTLYFLRKLTYEVRHKYFVLAAVLAAILDSINITLLQLREIDFLILKLLNLIINLLL